MQLYIFAKLHCTVTLFGYLNFPPPKRCLINVPDAEICESAGTFLQNTEIILSLMVIRHSLITHTGISQPHNNNGYVTRQTWMLVVLCEECYIIRFSNKVLIMM